MHRAKAIEVEQGSDKWAAARRGRITASRMGDVLAKKTTNRYQDYQSEIAQELMGIEVETDAGPWFDHGKAMEPYARGAYEWKYGIELTNNVMFIHPEYDWLSASPDGVRVGTLDHPVEIKCRATHECADRKGNLRSCGGCGDPLRTWRKVREYIERTGKPEATYRPQIQAQAWVIGAPSIEYINYYHDPEQRVRKLHVLTVPRDEAYISQMEDRCMEFMIECYELANKDKAMLEAA